MRQEDRMCEETEIDINETTLLATFYIAIEGDLSSFVTEAMAIEKAFRTAGQAHTGQKTRSWDEQGWTSHPHARQ